MQDILVISEALKQLGIINKTAVSNMSSEQNCTMTWVNWHEDAKTHLSKAKSYLMNMTGGQEDVMLTEIFNKRLTFFQESCGLVDSCGSLSFFITWLGLMLLLLLEYRHANSVTRWGGIIVVLLSSVKYNTGVMSVFVLAVLHKVLGSVTVILYYICIGVCLYICICLLYWQNHTQIRLLHFSQFVKSKDMKGSCFQNT